jgi:hypothetical protein
MSEGPGSGCDTDRSTDSACTVVEHECAARARPSGDSEDVANNVEHECAARARPSGDSEDAANSCDEMPPYADSLTNAGVSEIEARLREQARAAGPARRIPSRREL